MSNILTGTLSSADRWEIWPSVYALTVTDSFYGKLKMSFISQDSWANKMNFIERELSVIAGDQWKV